MTKTSRGFSMIELVLGLSFLVLMMVAAIAMASSPKTSTIQEGACNVDDEDHDSKNSTHSQPCGKQKTTKNF